MRIQCALGDFTSNAHWSQCAFKVDWIHFRAIHFQRWFEVDWSGLSTCAHTEPHLIAIHATRRAFIDLSFRVYMNLEVFGSMMAAGWSNKASKILLTVWWCPFNGAVQWCRTYLRNWRFLLKDSFLLSSARFFTTYFLRSLAICVCKAA